MPLQVPQMMAEAYLAEVEHYFLQPLEPAFLAELSNQFLNDYQNMLQGSPICMLPSFSHLLPTGREVGDYLSVDVGGSTLGIALVRLGGIPPSGHRFEVVCSEQFAIDNSIRSLNGQAFFVWIATCIERVLLHCDTPRLDTLAMGLSWSFPIDQTSPTMGLVLTMGKNFTASTELQGQDLHDLLMDACRKRNLNICLQSILNDASATLIARAYLDPTTRLSLILGTGVNAAIYLPVSTLAANKLANHSGEWLESATHTIVNTELSMFGRSFLPTSPWDARLRDNHKQPDFQPLEQMIGGRYLGEIVRLILVDATRRNVIFDGQVPAKLDEPYALDTKLMAALETRTASNADNVSTNSTSRTTFSDIFSLPRPMTTSEEDLACSVARLVSTRAAALLAAAIHALWRLSALAASSSNPIHDNTSVACHGTVFDRYPAFRARTQGFLDGLTRPTSPSSSSTGMVSLEMMAHESCLIGAAVAAATNHPT